MQMGTRRLSARARIRAGVAVAACCVVTAGIGSGARAEGPEAIQYLPGCTDNALPRNDDESSGPVELGFGVRFYGQSYTSVFVNNNGNVSFDDQLSEYTPAPLWTAGTAIIAPYFADVDTRDAGSDVVRYGQTTVAGRPALCVNWAGTGVGYYDMGSDRRSSFQLLLVGRGDIGDGDFDIVMNYDKVQWEAGIASGGVGGLGGHPARIGFSGGEVQSSFEMGGSGLSGWFLDSSPSGLIHGAFGTGQLGRYVFPMRNGRVCVNYDDDGDGAGKCDGDCDDDDAAVRPGATEVCDGADNDCNGAVDDGGACAPVCVTILSGVNGQSEDAQLSGDYPGWAAGTSSGAYTGASAGGNLNRVLWRFDLAPVLTAMGGGPATVTSATMRVYVAWNEEYTRVSVHRALAPWSEATVTGGSYPSSKWEATAFTSFEVGGFGERAIDLTALAQRWLDGSAENNGVLFTEPAPARHYFHTREAATPALRPSLEVCSVRQ